MKDIKGDDNNRFWDYDDVLESMEYTILVQTDDSDYQGDTRVLFKDGSRYGILIFGWGSCSGCDALQGCSSIEDVHALRDELHREIQWFASPVEALEYIKKKDWEASFLDRERSEEFVHQSISALENIIYHWSVDEAVKKL